MKKRKYIAPETELVRLFDDLLTVPGESKWKVGDGSGDGNSGEIIEGDLGSGVEIAAKPYHGWEDVDDNEDWGN